MATRSHRAREPDAFLRNGLRLKQYLHSGDYLLWGTIAALQLVLLAFACRQKLTRKLPWYVGLLAFFSAKSIALMAVAQLSSYALYMYAYYVGITIEIPLLILVVYDFFKIVFEPRSTLPPGTLPKISLTMVCVFLAGAVAAIWRPSQSTDVMLALLRTVHRSTEFVVCCSLWTVIVYARFMGIPWTRKVAGIASGFLFYLTTQTLVTSVLAFVGQQQPWVMILNRVSSGSYLVGLGFWAIALSRKDIPVEMPTQAELGYLQTLWTKVAASHARLQQSLSDRSKA
ncbi:MAG TPA: hypothetical protein VHA33_29140 [Candidatus Angelobacter sp.]|jgi:hypothetical protein|nr:hypothetical protein [Candidatus Angelobacter sp.]